MNENPGRFKSNKSVFVTAGAILGLISVFFLGVFIGAANTKPETITRIETQTETVEKTPKECAEYIDYANRGFSLLSEILIYNDEALKAIANMDYVGVNAATKKVDGVNAELEVLAPKLNAAKAACAAAK